MVAKATMNAEDRDRIIKALELKHTDAAAQIKRLTESAGRVRSSHLAAQMRRRARILTAQMFSLERTIMESKAIRAQAEERENKSKPTH